MQTLLKDGIEQSLEGGERVSLEGICMKRIQPHGGPEVGTWPACLRNSKPIMGQMERVKGRVEGDETGEVMGLR